MGAERPNQIFKCKLFQSQKINESSVIFYWLSRLSKLIWRSFSCGTTDDIWNNVLKNQTVLLIIDWQHWDISQNILYVPQNKWVIQVCDDMRVSKWTIPFILKTFLRHHEVNLNPVFSQLRNCDFYINLYKLISYRITCSVWLATAQSFSYHRAILWTKG